MNANSDPDGFDVVDDAGAVIGAAVTVRVPAIRAALWDVMASPNTLKVIICRIREKIRLTGAPIEILTVGHIG